MSLSPAECLLTNPVRLLVVSAWASVRFSIWPITLRKDHATNKRTLGKRTNYLEFSLIPSSIRGTAEIYSIRSHVLSPFGWVGYGKEPYRQTGSQSVESGLHGTWPELYRRLTV